MKRVRPRQLYAVIAAAKCHAAAGNNVHLFARVSSLGLFCTRLKPRSTFSSSSISFNHSCSWLVVLAFLFLPRDACATHNAQRGIRMTGVSRRRHMPALCLVAKPSTSSQSWIVVYSIFEKPFNNNKKRQKRDSY